METLHFGILLILGIALSGGILGAWFFQKLHIPQVIGYIAIGLVIGQSGFKLISVEHIDTLRSANLFALGIIGFLVGGELKLGTFKKYARQFAAVLLGEGLTAFFLVGALCSVGLYCVTHSWPPALAAGLVFGAIASATDPASTLDVLYEYRARGILTTSLIAIVALDDALAMTLYGLGTGAAQLLAGGDSVLSHELIKVIIELGGAIVVGAIFGYALSLYLRRDREPAKGQAIAISVILLDIGISKALQLDVILSAMTVGFTLINLAPRRSEDLFKLVRHFALPIYVFFFVLVGARITLAQMPLWLWGIVGLYVIGRNFGKMAGAYFGARISGGERCVRRYLGMGLFAQGGVAIGLSVMASEHLDFIQVTDTLSLSQIIVSGVTATTLIVQLIGPPMVKLAIKLAGESGRDVSKEDVIASWKVADVMQTEVIAMDQKSALSRAMEIFSEQDFVTYPVVDAQNTVVGTLSLENMKHMLPEKATWDWVVVADVMSPAQDKVSPDTSLSDALGLMHTLKLSRMPVILKNGKETLVGMLSLDHAEKRISQEVIERQGAAMSHADAAMAGA